MSAENSIAYRCESRGADAVSAARRRCKRFLRDTSGVSAIEFGFFSPILVIGLIIAADLGNGIIRHTELTGAARAAAQYAQVKRPVQKDFDQIEQAALDALSITDPNELQGVTVATTLVCECSGGGSGSCNLPCPTGEFRETFLTVAVSQQWTPLIPYPVVTWPMTLTGEATMRFQ